VVGGSLAPTLVSAVGGDAHKGDKRVGEGFNALDFHNAQCKTRTLQFIP
jgi:hypothetical protein